MSRNPAPPSPTPSARRAAGLSPRVVKEVFDEIHKKGDIYRLGETQLAREFAGAFFDGNPSKAAFSELRDVIAALWARPDDVPADERAFAIWLRKEILWLSELPRDALLDLYTEASADLATIAQNIETCQHKTAAIRKRDPKTDHDRPDERFYDHYRLINVAAQEEIVRVLRNGLKYEALRRSRRKHPLPMIDFHVPWSFRWCPERFDPELFSELANKFGGLPIQDLKGAERLFASDLAQFDLFLDQYFGVHNPVRDVRQAIPKHHRLFPRGKVLEAALRAFEQGEFDLFIATSALQVEGIFEDCCLDLGVKQESLLKETLVPKLDALTRAAGGLADYAYYAFRFPIVRNKIAHGRILPGDQARTARLLLLDLRDACDILQALPSVSNKLVWLLHSIAPTGPTMKDLVKFASLLEPSGELMTLDPYYDLAEKIRRMEEGIATSEFWDYLVDLAKRSFPELHAGLSRIAVTLKEHKNSRTVQVLKSIAKKGKVVQSYDQEEFWQSLDTSGSHPPLGDD